MKLKILIATMLLLPFGAIAQQEWPQPEATWEYCKFNEYLDPAGHVIYWVNGDTIIKGKTYKIICPKPEENNPNIMFNCRLFTRYSNDTVYRYVNNREYLFFTFNLNLGDIITTFRTAGFASHWNDSACSSILPLKVIEIGEIEQNGNMLKKTILEDTLFKHLYSTNHPAPTYTLVERIGIINTFPFINLMESPGSFGDCMLASDFISVRLGSYTDKSIKHIFEECKGLGVENYNKETLLIVKPNPAKDYTIFEYKLPENQASAVIQIFDIAGKVVQTIDVSQKQGQKTWYTGSVKAGMYLYSIKSGNQTSKGKITIVK